MGRGLISLAAAPVWNSMPRFLRLVRSRLARSRSNWGSTSLQNSMTVTCDPRAWKMLANSSPMTPPPMMQSRWGRVARFSISVLVTTPSACAPGIGRNFVTLPVAMMILGAENSLSIDNCPLSIFLTATVWLSRNRASPSTSVIPGVFISCATPVFSFSTTSFLRAMAAAR